MTNIQTKENMKMFSHAWLEICTYVYIVEIYILYDNENENKKQR